jgi:mRNA interferase RelE/StbE
LSYELVFYTEALDQWNKLDNSVRVQFKKKLAKLLVAPFHDSAELANELRGSYKIKLRKLGYRLIYQIDEFEKQLIVVTVGLRDGKQVYIAALQILSSGELSRMRE